MELNFKKRKFKILIFCFAIFLIAFRFSEQCFADGYIEEQGELAERDFEYIIIDLEVTITKYIGKNTIVDIPETIDGKTVIAIGDFAFKDLNRIVEVNIPEGVISIGNHAFSGCESLEKITIPESIVDIGDYAFYLCTYLPNIDLPNGLETIGDYAFQRCVLIETINIPETLTEIGNRAFFHCHKLWDINIPESVIFIEHGAFENCSSLGKLTIHNVEMYFASTTFNGCDNLTIYSYEGSEIERYAKDYGINFVSIGYTVYFEIPGRYDLSFSIGVLENDLIPVPEDPKVGGYTFLGWYKDRELTILWDFEKDRVNSIITIFANMDMINIEELDNNSIIFKEKQIDIPLNKIWTIEFNYELDISTVDETKVLVFDTRYGEFVPCKVYVHGNTITIEPIWGKYRASNDYVLYVMSDIKSISGKTLENNVKMEFRTV